MSDNLYKTVRIAAVSVVMRGDEWHILGYPDDWNGATNDHPYTIGIFATAEEAVAKHAVYYKRLRAEDGKTLRTFARGVRRHLHEYLLP